MLTRLKVSGFKNLVDVDVRFGPFTCVAGANGTGKSNLFDAIQFLSALASHSLIEAALSIRSEGEQTADVRNLFHRIGDDYTQRMSFEVEMIVPRTGLDDLRQEAEASITFLRYKVSLGYRVDERLPTLGSLELLHEELTHINISDAHKHLRFPHSAKYWRRSIIQGKRSGGAFISTSEEDEGRIVKLHQDGGSRGRPQSYLALSLPRTVLSSATARESPTALLARREMQSWRLLQLEPSALREPDRFDITPGLGVNGAHLPATVYYLTRFQGAKDAQGVNGNRIYDEIAARLSELIDDVNEVRIDRDEIRQLLTLEVKDRRGTTLPARSLSDGTLRFLALSVISLDPDAKGVICLEEPENGIHPERIPAILRLLQDIAVDVDMPVGPDNPLRQIIINTHSPAVVSQVPDDSLLIAELKEVVQDGDRFKAARFSWLPETWRQDTQPDVWPVSRGKLLSYLNPVYDADEGKTDENVGKRRKRRVVDRPDLQLLLFPDLIKS